MQRRSAARNRAASRRLSMITTYSLPFELEDVSQKSFAKDSVATELA
jgi:hypothetical protein